VLAIAGYTETAASLATGQTQIASIAMAKRPRPSVMPGVLPGVLTKVADRDATQQASHRNIPADVKSVGATGKISVNGFSAQKPRVVKLRPSRGFHTPGPPWDIFICKEGSRVSC
jgi:hypothetical protein